MSETVYVGLVVCSHAPGVPCEARFSNVVVSETAYEITDVEVLTNPKEALAKAYRNLEQLGNWRDDVQTFQKHRDLIASSLFAIARARQLGGESDNTVLPDYYRIAELVPNSPATTDALVQIALLDGEKGLKYATKYLEARPLEERDEFYLAMMKDHVNRPGTAEGEIALNAFVEYVAKTLRFTLLAQVITGLGFDEQGMSVCKSLIQCGMANPSNVQVAVVGLRYMAVKAPKGQARNHIQELLQWAVSHFEDSKLSPYAMAALADTYYEQGFHAEALETFLPELFSADEVQAKTVQDIEGALATYRAHTLLQTTINPERIYEALSERAGGSGHHVVNLHCQRRIAELRGLSLEGFKQSARQGLKYCQSDPEHEIWFWEGLIAASEGDLATATTAYERFLEADGESVLAARAYYDIARAKMAIGEDAELWIGKAKALSPCDVVIQLEQRFNGTASARG
jgi:tetratricopeptide (TPR) repeat protein